MDPLEDDDFLSVENQYSDQSIGDTCLNSIDDSSEKFLYNDEDNCLSDDKDNSLISDDHLNQLDTSDGVYFSDDSENDSDHQEATFNNHQEATFGVCS